MDDFFANISQDSAPEFSMSPKTAKEEQPCGADVPDSTPASCESACSSNEPESDDGDGTSLTFLPGHSSAMRKRKSGSAIQTIFEVLFGGLAGVLAAYYGLAWYQGPAFDLPKFGLPGIERLTAKPLKPEGTKKSDDPKKPDDAKKLEDAKKSSSESKSKPRTKSESKSQ
jgi:hypothetical protein